MPEGGIETVGGLESFDFGFAVKEMGKSVHQGELDVEVALEVALQSTVCGLMELQFLSMVGLPYLSSSFKCLAACLLVLKYVLMGWNFDACTTFQVLFNVVVVSN